VAQFSFKQLGPGLLFAGAAIGVSHLVQSTGAGASYGFGLLWALLLIHLIKYPFFQFGPRYAAATGKSLLDAYLKLGKGVLWFYFMLNLLSMFTIQAAVTVVTASLASYIFGSTMSIFELVDAPYGHLYCPSYGGQISLARQGHENNRGHAYCEHAGCGSFCFF
jgi:Mn2+/Fe2+ NRAMP family transporter